MTFPIADDQPLDDATNALTFAINGAAFAVHAHFGPGLPEAIYHEALLIELRHRGLDAKTKFKIPVYYRGVRLLRTYEMDILVNDEIIVELKSAEALTGIHLAQLLSYLRLTGKRVGLIYNFNARSLARGGQRRIVNPDLTDPTERSESSANSASSADSASP